MVIMLRNCLSGVVNMFKKKQIGDGYCELASWIALGLASSQWNV